MSIGVSFGALYVFKGVHKGSMTKNCIVAQYVGRPQESDDVSRIAMMFAILYNTEVMFENEVTHVKNYFRRMNRLDLLALQPDKVISNNIKNSKVARVYGCHMNEKMKDAGEKYIKDWLLEVQEYDENGSPITTIDSIYDIGLLEELIAYNRKVNTDRCLIEGTKIKTKGGLKNVEDIKIGDEVLTYDGSIQKVSNVMENNFSGNLIKLNISGEAEDLIVTENHPLLIGSSKGTSHCQRKKALNNFSYKRADSLTDKYQFSFIPKRKELIDNIYNPDMLYLLGWIMADGHIDFKTKRLRITLQKNQYEIAKDLCEIINKYREKENIANNRVYKPVDAKIVDYKTFYRVEVTSKRIQEIAISIGYKPGDKKLSEWFYNSKDLMPFVIGYFEGDGTQQFSEVNGYKRCNLMLSTKYKELSQQVRQILFDNNIYSSVSIVRKDNQYRINISSNYIDYFLSFYESKKFKKCFLKNKLNVTYEDEFGFYTPIKIREIERVENLKVYNFEVENNHTYIANNIVNHNCMALMQVMFQRQEEQLDKVYDEDRKDRIAEVFEVLKGFYRKR